MTLEMKHCNGCGKDKKLSEFNFNKSGKQIGKPRGRCRECGRKECIDWRKLNPKKVKRNNDIYHYSHGTIPASENKLCSAYLGIVIAETIISHEFPGFVRMPYGNPGYDYDCPKGFKIDVKSRCKMYDKNANARWGFHIRLNNVANYFICIAFGDRDKPLVPEHVWLIPGSMVSDQMLLSISDSPKSLAKWSQYERPLENVLNCCNKLRGDGEHDITQDVNTDAKS